MFLERFGFKEHPFPAGPDPGCLFVGRPQEEALAHLRYAVSEGEGFSVVLGEEGAGKTTICRAFAERLAGAHDTAFLSAPLRTGAELVSELSRQLGLEEPGAHPRDRHGALNRFLMERRIAGRRVVVFIDNAQDLPPAVLEQVRLLSNLETTRDKLILIVLIGDPGLEKLLHSRKLRQMGQRVSVSFAIAPLDERETLGYIEQKLACRGAAAPVRFSAEAVRWVFRASGGNPARVNRACTAVLNAAAGSGLAFVDGETARAALFGPEPLPAAALRKMMSPPWAKRLAAGAGAAVLLLLLVFFLRPPVESPASPPANEVVVKTLGRAEEPPAEAAVQPVLQAPNDRETPSKAEKPREPASAPRAPGAYSWSVQTGAFLQPENAQRALSGLTGRGWPARIAVFRDGKGQTWHTVRIGDHADRGRAEAQAAEFRRREGKAAVVRPYGAL